MFDDNSLLRHSDIYTTSHVSVPSTLQFFRTVCKKTSHRNRRERHNCKSPKPLDVWARKMKLIGEVDEIYRWGCTVRSMGVVDR